MCISDAGVDAARLEQVRVRGVAVDGPLRARRGAQQDVPDPAQHGGACAALAGLLPARRAAAPAPSAAAARRLPSARARHRGTAGFLSASTPASAPASGSAPATLTRLATCVYICVCVPSGLVVRVQTADGVQVCGLVEVRAADDAAEPAAAGGVTAGARGVSAAPAPARRSAPLCTPTPRRGYRLSPQR